MGWANRAPLKGRGSRTKEKTASLQGYLTGLASCPLGFLTASLFASTTQNLTS